MVGHNALGYTHSAHSSTGRFCGGLRSRIRNVSRRLPRRMDCRANGTVSISRFWLQRPTLRPVRTARRTWRMMTICFFDAIAHLKIVDVSCPQQMLSVMQWIMEGNRGLVYLRVLRTPSAVLYGPDYGFEFGKGVVLRSSEDDVAMIVSSGRGVHEALSAAVDCAQRGVNVGVGPEFSRLSSECGRWSASRFGDGSVGYPERFPRRNELNRNFGDECL